MPDDIEEVKTLFGDTQRVLKETRDKVVAMEGKSADYIDRDTLRKMQDELAAKMTAADEASAKVVEDLKAKVAALETKGNRPGALAQAQSPEAKAMNAYLRKGVEPDEMKAMATNTAEGGGFAIPVQMRDGIQERQRRSSPIRQVASVVMLEGSSYDILVERGDAGFQWASETGTRAETDTPTIQRISIPLHELSAMPKISQRLLDTASFDIEGWLSRYIADRFARAEAGAFVSGDGTDKPRGFLTYAMSAADDAARATAALQYIPTGADGDFATAGPADVLVHAFYELQAAYQANATWMMKNKTMARVATLKDDAGNYILKEMLNADGSLVRTIEGRPAVIADDMPVIGSNSLSIAVGDFQAGYTIVEGPNMTILRDPFSAKPNVLFFATKRMGGGVSDFDAIKAIRFSAA